MPRAMKLSALAALILLTLPACSSSKSVTVPSSVFSSSTGATTPTGTGTAATSPTATASPSASESAVAGTQIVISKFLYAPVNLVVKPGATVTVMNQDAVAHTVTATATGGGIPFDTGTINPNSTGQFTAPATPGTYPYGCTFHPYMHGTLTVKA